MSTTKPRTAADLFEEYRKDHDAALEPCIYCLIDRCPPEQEEQLRALLEMWLDSDRYRTPPYSPVQSRRLQERIQPLLDRVLHDPAVVAHEDQMNAAWRDKPWWRKRWSRLRFRVRWAWITRPRPFTKKPWE